MFLIVLRFSKILLGTAWVWYALDFKIRDFYEITSVSIHLFNICSIDFLSQNVRVLHVDWGLSVYISYEISFDGISLAASTKQSFILFSLSFNLKPRVINVLNIVTVSFLGFMNSLDFRRLYCGIRPEFFLLVYVVTVQWWLICHQKTCRHCIFIQIFPQVLSLLKIALADLWKGNVVINKSMVFNFCIVEVICELSLLILFVLLEI